MRFWLPVNRRIHRGRVALYIFFVGLLLNVSLLFVGNIICNTGSSSDQHLQEEIRYAKDLKDNSNKQFHHKSHLLYKCTNTQYATFSHYKGMTASFIATSSSDSAFHRAWNLLYNRSLDQPNCIQYNQHINLNYNVCVDVFNSVQSENNADVDVTLVTQLTLNRFDSVKRLALKWRGPMSVAFYLTASELHENASQIQQWITETGRRNIVVHFMIQNGTYFPINKLRNLALENARTEFIFQVDVDFIPSASLEFDIKREIEQGFFQTNTKRALVVIALQTSDDWIVPVNKMQAARLLDTDILQLFNYENFSQGHGPCNVTQWKTATGSYQITYSDGFEPFVVLKRSMAPRYPVQFLERYKNKISHTALLHREGFEFHVLANSFIVHAPHAKTSTRAAASKSCAEAHYKLLCYQLNMVWCQGDVDRRKSRSTVKSSHPDKTAQKRTLRELIKNKIK